MIFDSGFVRLPINRTGRDLIVGDVHGQGALLERLLAGVGFNPPRDRLFLLGDLIDRGPDGATLIERVEQEASWFSVCGNHEALMRASEWSDEARCVWRRNRNDWSMSLQPDRLDRLFAILRGLPLAMEVPLVNGRTIGLVHAEVLPGKPWSALNDLRVDDFIATEDSGSTTESSLIWGRKRIKADGDMRFNPKARAAAPYYQVKTWQAAQPVPGIDLVVAGHVVISPRLPRGRSNTLWINTGACEKDGGLTAIDSVANCYWQAENWSTGIIGPTPLPPMSPPERAWRPTTDIEAAAAAYEAQQIELISRLLP